MNEIQFSMYDADEKVKGPIMKDKNDSKRTAIPENTIASGRRHTVGLKSDDTVVAVGWNEHGQCNISNWRDMLAVAAGCAHTLGLKSDGTVVVWVIMNMANAM